MTQWHIMTVTCHDTLMLHNIVMQVTATCLSMFIYIYIFNKLESSIMSNSKTVVPDSATTRAASR